MRRLLSRAGGGAAALRLAGRASDYYIHEIRRDTAGGAPVMDWDDVRWAGIQIVSAAENQIAIGRIEYFPVGLKLGGRDEGDQSVFNNIISLGSIVVPRYGVYIDHWGNGSAPTYLVGDTEMSEPAVSAIDTWVNQNTIIGGNIQATSSATKDRTIYGVYSNGTYSGNANTFYNTGFQGHHSLGGTFVCVRTNKQELRLDRARCENESRYVATERGHWGVKMDLSMPFTAAGLGPTRPGRGPVAIKYGTAGDHSRRADYTGLSGTVPNAPLVVVSSYGGAIASSLAGATVTESGGAISIAEAHYGLGIIVPVDQYDVIRWSVDATSARTRAVPLDADLLPIVSSAELLGYDQDMYFSGGIYQLSGSIPNPSSWVSANAAEVKHLLLWAGNAPQGFRGLTAEKLTGKFRHCVPFRMP